MIYSDTHKGDGIHDVGKAKNQSKSDCVDLIYYLINYQSVADDKIRRNCH